MNPETTILPEAQGDAREISPADGKGPEAGAAPAESRILESAAPEAAPEAPKNAPEAPPATTSPLLAPEISAILGTEVTAILEADWAKKSRGASSSAAPPSAAKSPESKQGAAKAPSGKAAAQAEAPGKSQKKEKAGKPAKKRSLGRKIFCFARRTLLVILLAVVLIVSAAAMACHAIFNGPSQDAKEMLYSTFMEPSATKWIPGLFLSKEEINAIENKKAPLPPSPDISGEIIINTDTSINGDNDEWKEHPDGIRIEHITGESYTAHVMIIRDPSRVYLGTSNRDFSRQKDGMRLNEAMSRFGAVAGINGGAFWDNGTASAKVGSVPEGLVISQGEILWNKKDTSFPDNGFAGFNRDNVLIVAKSMTAAQAQELGIRDGVAFGPVLIVDGKGNADVYNNKAGGQNPRTCIGQRADGAVIFLCIDGRQANSLGGTYADCIDILTEYGAVNACNLDGGSSSTMFYRDVYGKYKEEGEVFMVNNYSLLQSTPRKMPTFFLVAPEKEGE